MWCRSCNRTGHVSRFCDSSNALRYIHEEPVETDDMKDFESASVISWETTEQPEGFLDSSTSPAIMTVQIGDEDRVPEFCNVGRSQRNRKSKRQCSADPEIEAWIKYIDGEIKEMPKHGNASVLRQPRKNEHGSYEHTTRTPTVISKSRAEGAAKKPLVMGRCGNVQTPLLIDSGAALNVIDESFVKSLPANSIIKRDLRENRIRCANDEIVRSKGRVTLMVSIGSRSENMVFSIMPSLFPKIIIGLRQMKHSKMVIDPPEDSLWVEGQRVKFISKTEALSTVNM